MAPKTTVTRPTFIDPMVWSVATKRKKKGWDMRSYLGLMTIPPSEADIVLRSPRSKLNQEYGATVPAGIPEVKSVNDAIAKRSDNLAIPYEQARRDVYGAIEWMIVDPNGTYAADEDYSNYANSPDDGWRALAELDYPMAAFFMLDIIRFVADKSDHPNRSDIERAAWRYQRLMLRHWSDASSQDYRMDPSRGRTRPQPEAASLGTLAWVQTQDMDTYEAIAALSPVLFETGVGDSLTRNAIQVMERRHLYFLAPSMRPLESTTGFMREQIGERGLRAAWSSYYEGMKHLIQSRFSSFIWSWPPASVPRQPSGALRSSSALVWAAGGAIAGAAATLIAKRASR